MSEHPLTSNAHLLVELFLVFTFIQYTVCRQNWTVSIYDSVNLTCKSDSRGVRNWKHGNVVLFHNKLKIDFNLDHVDLLDDYSLLIRQIELEHEGLYHCWLNESIVAEFMFDVEVPPTLFMTTNAVDNLTAVNIEANTTVTFFCHAVGARPPVDLSWTIDGENRHLDVINFTVKEDGEYGVLPDLHISVNGERIANNITLLAEQLVRFVCNASASRPKSYILWYVNNMPMETFEGTNKSDCYFERDEGLYDTVSAVWYQPKEYTGSITCASHVELIGEIVEVHVKYFTYVKDISAEHQYDIWKIVCVMFVLSLIVAPLSLFIAKKLCDVTVNREKIHWDNFVKRVQDIPHHNNLVKLEGICINQDPIPVFLESRNGRPFSNISHEWPANHLELK
ncbi:hypothetical protein HOLleu_00940 [Holothuria leucospilota]|uniref:Ig-like domain-containing protein n=1 Tax=Holothuria leucospilota TaxID=206669 RepID=A0A9Q1CPS5_HOLLE|nr:hypothetical protein HOLleu_00940 [Holothuria leucospilota]